jgi:hypothetical protein
MTVSAARALGRFDTQSTEGIVMVMRTRAGNFFLRSRQPKNIHLAADLFFNYQVSGVKVGMDNFSVTKLHLLTWVSSAVNRTGKINKI